MRGSAACPGSPLGRVRRRGLGGESSQREPRPPGCLAESPGLAPTSRPFSRPSVPFPEGAVFIKTVSRQFSNINRFFFFSLVFSFFLISRKVTPLILLYCSNIEKSGRCEIPCPGLLVPLQGLRGSGWEPERDIIFTLTSVLR